MQIYLMYVLHDTGPFMGNENPEKLLDLSIFEHYRLDEERTVVEE